MRARLENLVAILKVIIVRLYINVVGRQLDVICFVMISYFLLFNKILYQNFTRQDFAAILWITIYPFTLYDLRYVGCYDLPITIYKMKILLRCSPDTHAGQ